MSTDLSKYNNHNYQPGGSFKRGMWYVVNRLFFKSSWFPPSLFKNNLLKLFGSKIGKGVIIKPRVNIKYPWFLEIGDHSWIGENVWIDNVGMVSIGANVCISQGALLLGGNHDFTKSTFDLIVSSIVIEDGVWIGAQSVVCGGVTCRSNAVLAVGSVASSDLELNGIYRGNPAVKIKDRIFK